MGLHEYPCPSCGQGQKVRAQAGQEVLPAPCASCREKEIENDHARAKADLTEAEYATRYGSQAAKVRRKN